MGAYVRFWQPLPGLQLFLSLWHFLIQRLHVPSSPPLYVPSGWPVAGVRGTSGLRTSLSCCLRTTAGCPRFTTRAVGARGRLGASAEAVQPSKYAVFRNTLYLDKNYPTEGALVGPLRAQATCEPTCRALGRKTRSLSSASLRALGTGSKAGRKIPGCASTKHVIASR